MMTLQIFFPKFPLRVGRFFAGPVTRGSERQQHQLRREQRIGIAVGGGGRGWAVEEGEEV